jgi:hypothetical protein
LLHPAVFDAIRAGRTPKFDNAREHTMVKVVDAATPQAP